MANTLSKILVGSMGGSSGRLGRGASQKKWASPAHSVPAVFLAFSISAFTTSESGLAGTASGGCAWSSAAESRQQERITRFMLNMSFPLMSLGPAIGPIISAWRHLRLEGFDFNSKLSSGPSSRLLRLVIMQPSVLTPPAPRLYTSRAGLNECKQI